MATTGTYTFNPDLGEIMEEAFERAGAELKTANDIKTARRSLNYIALEWQNKGINLWTLDEQSISSSTIVASTATYDIDINTIGILDAVIRTDDGDADLQSDLPIEMITNSEYSQIPNKLTTGRPLQYMFKRIGVKSGTSGGADVDPTVTFWPVPDESSKYTFVYWRMRRIQDAGTNVSNTMDVPDRFIPALTSALAWHIATKKPSSAGRIPMLKDKKEEDWIEAVGEDRERVNFYIRPDMSAYR